MVLRLINATEAKPGMAIIVDDKPYLVKSNDISKTGKHGHAKARIEAIGILDGKKKIIAVPGHTRFEVPIIKKLKGQIMAVGDKVNIMDLENFETYDVNANDEIKSEIKEGDTVEYWDIEGLKIIKRKL